MSVLSDMIAQQPAGQQPNMLNDVMGSMLATTINASPGTPLSMGDFGYNAFRGTSGIEDISGESTYSRRNEQLPSIQGFIFHHTASQPSDEGGYPDAHKIIGTLNAPKPDATGGYGVQYIMERDGKIYQSLPSGARGAHILPSEINNLNNGNVEGMEVIAKNDQDVTPAQVSSAVSFARAYSQQHPDVQYFGHGEINPSHKMADEGLTIANAVRIDQGRPTNQIAKSKVSVPVENRTVLGYAHGSIEIDKKAPAVAAIQKGLVITGDTGE